jgi:hypothetical protein
MAVRAQTYTNNRGMAQPQEVRQPPLSPEMVELQRIQQSYAYARHRRQKEVDSRISYIRRLAECRQELTECCPCGLHSGIRFVAPVYAIQGQSGEVVLEENVCPKQWWVWQSMLALREGRLAAFTAAYPYHEYIHAYTL